MSTDPCQEDFDSWLKKYGYGRCDAIMRKHNKARLLNPGREKRKKLPPRQKEKLYAKQGGRCAECQEPFHIEQLEADHIDPNRQDLNAPANWQLLCLPCNREKGALSVMEQTKHYNKTAVDIIGEDP